MKRKQRNVASLKLQSALENALSVKVLKDDVWKFLKACYPDVINLGRWSELGYGDFFGIKSFIRENARKSYSQLQQDLVAQFIFHKAQELRVRESVPFFVEIGANDGLHLSNTYALEASFGWHGLVSEANKELIPKLQKNRGSCLIDSRAVTKYSGQELVFTETKNSVYSALKGTSIHLEQQHNSVETIVMSVSLTDLLIEKKAPSYIDFLSIDTEGNEYDILSGLNFNKFSFSFITVEASRDSEEISNLLESKGYIQILKHISLWDQWWIHTELLRNLVGQNDIVPSHYSIG